MKHLASCSAPPGLKQEVRTKRVFRDDEDQDEDSCRTDGLYSAGLRTEQNWSNRGAVESDVCGPDSIRTFSSARVQLMLQGSECLGQFSLHNMSSADRTKKFHLKHGGASSRVLPAGSS